MLRLAKTLLVYMSAFLFVMSLSVTGYKHATKKTFVVRVSHIESPIQNKPQKYLVFTERGVFENEDDFFSLKFNSADIRGAIQAGKKYTVTVNGIRSGFLSWFPNIISIKAIKE